MVGIIRPISLAIAILTLTDVSGAMAWGSLGHEATGEIAARFLSHDAKREIVALLGSATPKRLGKAARWADRVGRSKEPKSAAWHYVNVPTQVRRYHPKYCVRHVDNGKARPNECVVAMIRKFARIARDRRIGKQRRAEAVNYLIHFVGDIHMPLHCGNRGDDGGRAVKVKYRKPKFGKRRHGKRKHIKRKAITLHKFWDTAIVTSLHTYGKSIGEHLGPRITRSNLKNWSRGRASDWCSESVRIAHTQAYPPGAKRGGPAIAISQAFANRSLFTAQLRIQMAGVRIAFTLNRVFARRRGVSNGNPRHVRF